MINDARQAHAEETTLTLGADKGYDAKEFIEALQPDFDTFRPFFAPLFKSARYESMS
jgi:hypothetical protein